MHRSTKIFIVVLIIFAGLLGYNYFVQPFAPDELVRQEEEIVQEEALEEQIIYSAKDVSQLIAFPYLIDDLQSSESAQASEWIKQNKPGAVTLFGEKISTTSAEIAIQNLQHNFDLESQPIAMVDHEGGSVQRLNGQGFTTLPSWSSLCAMVATQRQGLLNASAQELAAVGVEVVLAPMIDVASQSAILGNRICAADAELVFQRAAEWIDIFSQHNILPVLKHFPGIGSIDRDLHLNYTQVNPSEAELTIFRNLLDTYPSLGVMTSHVGVKDFYEDQPCSLNEDCVGDLTEFFAEAIVFTDALDMEAAGYQDDGSQLSLADRAVAAIEAGNNVLIFGPNVSLNDLDQVMNALISTYEADAEFQEKVHASLAKIKLLKTSLRQ